MLNFFSRLRREPIWDFKGGIHPPEMKLQSSGTPLSQVPLPDQFILPLKQHIGHEGEILVSVGDTVLRGQPLTFGNGKMLPIHAPTSGVVTAITPHITAHPSGLPEIAVFIKPDGRDLWQKMPVFSDYQSCERAEIVDRIHQAGVAGLGGAGFPTATKVRGGLTGVNTLIINAAECEPYITADDRLMQDCAQEVIEGSRILGWLLQAEKIIVGIEDNKPEAIRALTQALGKSKDLIIRVIPTKYPSGGAKQLTKILTGREVPKGGRSSDIGVLMQNVGTAYAVKRAVIDGEPLTERVVTLTGDALSQPRNVWGRLGTPVEHLLNFAGFQPQAEQMVIMGGPLMGFTLPALDVPIVKISNCLLAPSANEMGPPEEEQGCIRCGACAEACPAGLLPQQLFWYCQGGDHDKARAYNLNDCIECGACAYVCPSNIPLVQYYRQEKAELLAIDIEAQRTQEAKARFEARQARLEKEKLAREARHAAAKARVTHVEKDQVNAALERVKAKQASATTSVNTTAEKPDNSAVIAQRAARKAQARAYQAEQQAAVSEHDSRQAAVSASVAHEKVKQAAQQSVMEENVVTADDYDSQLHANLIGIEAGIEAVEPNTSETDPRKAAVAAAVARAKAKREAQAMEPTAEASAPTEELDPRKAAVAAAVARAKAKRAAQATEPTVEASAATEELDPRKAAVAAAVARAKAKRAAQATEPTVEASAPTEELDPRKAAVAAAVARAKAKRAAQAMEPTVEASAATEELDPRKAAVAAAVARAKAKRAAQATEPTGEASAATEELDPRKAAVAAAVARAKAKRAAQAMEPTVEASAPTEELDPRKAAVAAAVARAKAKRAAQGEQLPHLNETSQPSSVSEE